MPFKLIFFWWKIGFKLSNFILTKGPCSPLQSLVGIIHFFPLLMSGMPENHSVVSEPSAPLPSELVFHQESPVPPCSVAFPWRLRNDPPYSLAHLEVL